MLVFLDKVHAFYLFIYFINIFFISKFLSPLRLESRTSHKSSPTLYHLSQAASARYISFMLSIKNYINYQLGPKDSLYFKHRDICGAHVVLKDDSIP